MSHRDDVRGVRDDLDRLLADPAADEAGLAAVLRLLRSTAQGSPPEPGPALRRLMEHGSPQAVPIRSRLATQAALVERRRRAVRAGFAGLGAGVKVALVAGVAAALTGAAVVDPVPDVVREPARAVITQLGDVVAPWGRGARDGTGRGGGPDRGGGAEQDPGADPGGGAERGEGAERGGGAHGSGPGKRAVDIDRPGDGPGAGRVDRPEVGTGGADGGRPSTSDGTGGRGTDAREDAHQGRDGPGPGTPDIEQDAEGGVGSGHGAPAVRDRADVDPGRSVGRTP